MNNLEKAKRAISGKRNFKIFITEKEDFEIEIEAKNEQEAKELAMEAHCNGESNSLGGDGGSITNIEEL